MFVFLIQVLNTIKYPNFLKIHKYDNVTQKNEPLQSPFEHLPEKYAWSAMKVTYVTKIPVKLLLGIIVLILLMGDI